MEDGTIDQAREMDVREVAIRLGLNVRGSKAICFKGHDSNASLSFHPTANYWHCFGCGAGGDSIGLVRQVLGLSFVDAIRWLLDDRHIPNLSLAKRHEAPPRYVPELTVARPDPETYEALLKICPISNVGQEYISNRFPDQFDLNGLLFGESQDTAQAILSLEEKFGSARLERAGLLTNSRPVFWGHRLLIPFFHDERITYIQARALGKWTPKYLCLARIKKPIFNFDKIEKLDQSSILYICEGVFDAIAAEQNGWNAIGILGADSFQPEWGATLSKFRLRIAVDSDSAGELFAQRICNIMMRYNNYPILKRVRIGEDLADALKRRIDDQRHISERFSKS